MMGTYVREFMKGSFPLSDLYIFFPLSVYLGTKPTKRFTPMPFMGVHTGFCWRMASSSSSRTIEKVVLGLNEEYNSSL